MLTCYQCDTYTRLVRESIAAEEAADGRAVDLERIMDETGEDKVFAAMGVAKTITTVVASVDSSPEILAQVQEVVVPIIVLTLENKVLGACLTCMFRRPECSRCLQTSWTTCTSSWTA